MSGPSPRRLAVGELVRDLWPPQGGDNIGMCSGAIRQDGPYQGPRDSEITRPQQNPWSRQNRGDCLPARGGYVPGRERFPTALLDREDIRLLRKTGPPRAAGCFIDLAGRRDRAEVLHKLLDLVNYPRSDPASAAP